MRDFLHFSYFEDRMVSQCECTAQWQRINELATSWRRRRDDDTTTTRRRVDDDTTTRQQNKANTGPTPDPNYKREPFATHSGKNIHNIMQNIYMIITYAPICQSSIFTKPHHYIPNFRLQPSHDWVAENSQLLVPSIAMAIGAGDIPRWEWLLYGCSKLKEWNSWTTWMLMISNIKCVVNYKYIYIRIYHAQACICAGDSKFLRFFVISYTGVSKYVQPEKEKKPICR